MPLMQSKAHTTWQGNVQEGSGKLKVGSQAFPEQTVTLSARTESQDGHTNPEELIAAAHSVCYAMAFSSALTKNETPPEQLDVSATCSLERGDEGLKITQMDLSVKGSAPGLDAAQFEQLAKQAEQACPVSNALRGNVDIRLNVEGA